MCTQCHQYCGMIQLNGFTSIFFVALVLALASNYLDTISVNSWIQGVCYYKINYNWTISENIVKVKRKFTENLLLYRMNIMVMVHIISVKQREYDYLSSTKVDNTCCSSFCKQNLKTSSFRRFQGLLCCTETWKHSIKGRGGEEGFVV